MVKRVGNLMARIADRENLREAFLRASKGKASRQTVLDFRNNLDTALEEIRSGLLDGSFSFGKYHFFTIYDPKQRVICAASFPERVAAHAMMRICHPVFDQYQISDSYASRKDKGTYKALERAQMFCRRYRWFAKLDVCKYFDSIDHVVLLRQLCRLFKDKALLTFFRNLLDSYETSPGKGLPIGNLTSQYFANHYLSVADHYVKETMRVPAYVRYMDDMLLFDNDREMLKQRVKLLSGFIRLNLKLKLHVPVMNDVNRGVPFLGYVLCPSRMRLNGKSTQRFRKKMAELHVQMLANKITEKEYTKRSTCLFAFVDKADAGMLKKKLAYTTGMYPYGL